MSTADDETSDGTACTMKSSGSGEDSRDKTSTMICDDFGK